MNTRYVPVHRATAGVQDWLRKRLGPDPKHWDEGEAFWLPDGRVIPATETDYWSLTADERYFALPVRAVILEFEEERDRDPA